MSAPAPAHLACARLQEVLAAAPPPAGWVSASEAQRLQGIATERRRAQFLAARWLARTLLANVFGNAPTAWSLQALPDAPPAVTGRPDLSMTVSHSATWVACALSTHAIGLDLEAPERPRDIAGLIEVCCTPAEQELLATAADPSAFFYELWTVKESWLKRRQEWIAPRRLQQLDAAPSLEGEVRTWRAPGLHLALCAPGAQVQWWTPALAHAGCWRVTDLRPA